MPDYFWGARGAGVLFLAKSTGRFLISHRSAYVEQPETWGTWGGAISGNETPEQAARREATEETGYRGRLQLIPLHVFKSGTFDFHNFLAIVEDEFTPKLDWETKGFRWVEFGDWPEPIHFGFEELLKHSGRKIESYVPSNVGEARKKAAKKKPAKRKPKRKRARTRTLYHVTTEKALKKIRREGIKPQKSPMTTGAFGQDIRKVKGAVYAFEHPEDAVRWAWRISWEGHHKAVIIKFKSNAEWVEDTHWEAGTGKGKWLASLETVPPMNFIDVVDFDHLKVRAGGFDLGYLDEPIKSWLGVPVEENVVEGRKQFVLPARAKRAGEKLVWVDVDTFDKAFQLERDMYIGPGGTGAAISNRYEIFGLFFAEHDRIEVPEVYVDPRGRVSFSNGRHRYAYLRDTGHRKIAMSMGPEAIKNARKAGLLVSGESLEERKRVRSPLLNELSYRAEDVPKNFRVVFDLFQYREEDTRKTLEQLKSMELKGVTGISGKAEISITFLGVARDTMLVMNAEKFMAANKVSRIMYDNPHYLMQDNMRALKRLFNDRSKDNRQTTYNLFQYMFMAIKKLNKREYADYVWNLGDYTAGHQDLANLWSDKYSSTKINSVYDMAKWLKRKGAPEVGKKRESWGNKFIKEIWDKFAELPLKTIVDFLMGALKIAGKIYKSEGEWVVKGDTVKIPKRSRLFILRVPFTDEEREEYEEKIARGVDPTNAFSGVGHVHRAIQEDKLLDEYGIHDRYVVVFVDPNRWKKIQGDWFAKHRGESVEEDLLAEAKEIMFHGTSSKFLRSILKKGFIPEPKKKAWGAGTGYRESYPGTYFSNNFMTALSASTTMKQKYGGERLMVVAQVETRAKEVVIDEDNIPSASRLLDWYNREHLNLVGPAEHIWVALAEWKGTYKIDWDKIADLLFGYIAKGQYKHIPTQRWEPARAQVRKYAETWLAYRVSQVATREEKEEGKLAGRTDDEIVYVSSMDKSRIKEEYGKLPDFKKARAAFRKATDDLLKKMTDLSTVPEDAFVHNVRVTEPVTYRGANRILAVTTLEDVPFEDWDKVGYTSIIHVYYARGNAGMKKLIEERKRRSGPNFKVVYERGQRGPAYDNPRKKSESVGEAASRRAAMLRGMQHGEEKERGRKGG